MKLKLKRCRGRAFAPASNFLVRYAQHMVRYRRNLVSGGTFFFTVTLADRHSNLLVEHIAELRTAFRLCRSERTFTIDAIVVLPEHLHTIMTLPAGDADFSGRPTRAKGLFTRYVLAVGAPAVSKRQVGYDLWQRRFWEHTIRDDDDFARHVDYIHFNPVKHGLVRRVRDWPHSSFHRYVRCGLLPHDWGGAVPAFAGGYGERHATRAS